MSIGIGNVSVIFSTARIGDPAVILPTTGTSTNSFCVEKSFDDVFFASPSVPFNSLSVLPFLSCFFI